MAERYGDYYLERLIATGGMAEIYLATQAGMAGVSRPVVVKRMLPQLAVRPDFVQMFLDEARLAARISHPNIVSVYNLGEVDQSYYIAMEFVDGPHLGSLFAHSLRQRKPLPIEQCVYIVARAADGLHYAHELRDPSTGQQLNIVHRDISPQNVLVSRQGDVKVTDFGVAKSTSHQTKTRTGIIKGKVAYMSPEQCLGEVVDRRTDVFALGVVLYELLTRRRLFRDKSDLLIMQKITGEDVRAPSTVNKEIDEELDDICRRALARVKEYRYASAAELSEALDIWLAAKGYGDVQGALVRWFEQNALELSISAGTGGGSSGSNPSFSAPVSRPAGPTEATAATPSLSSMETALGLRPADRSDISAEATRRMVQRTVSEANTQESEPVSLPPSIEVSATRSLPLASGEQEGSLDDVTALPAPRRRQPLAALATIGGVVVVAVAALFLLPSGEQAGDTKVDELDTAAPVGRLKIETVPPGATVLVDDERVVRTPAEIEHAPGEVRLQAQFKDQAPVEETVELKEGESAAVRLIAKVPLIVKTKPPNAEVRVGATLEGETPFEKQALLSPEKPTKIRISLDGYKPIERTITAEPGAAVVIEETLAPAPGPPRPRPPVEAKPGVINMRSTPWVNVKLASGEKLGATTFTGQRVPAGRQTLLLSNPEQGINETLVVTVPEDKTLNIILEFEKKGNRWVLKTKSIK